MSGFLRWREERRAVAVGRAVRGLACPPRVEQGARDRNESAVWDVAALLDTVVAARRLARHRSLAGLLLRDAEAWLTIWLDEWEAHLARGTLTPHLFALYRQMAEHLARVSVRLSVAAEGEHGPGRHHAPGVQFRTPA
jgi:hypothetical protein